VSVERGGLRVYLGAAPGVGKTFAMLQEGQRRAERGTDVVIGYVESHGRAKTEAALGDLEAVPRRMISYRGLTVGELDLGAILARAPEVALVDELAHTNAIDPADPDPHAKRWQDVQSLLEAGIDVITTVNIQHLESLNDVVAQVTGVRQTETVPDRVVRAAEAVELVDMSPQALRRRMAHGNIYRSDRIDTALSHYFREGNLAALRELALLWLADRVDEGMDRYRDQHQIGVTWATRERVVVGVSGGKESQTLMRRAARIASRTGGGEWQAVHVSRRDGLTGMSPKALEVLRTAAEEMGGTFHAVVAHDSADGLLDFARGVNATQVLIGASRRSRLSTVLRPGVGETVIARSGDVDVHVVSHDFAHRRGLRRRRRTALTTRRLVVGGLLATAGTALLTLGLGLTPNLHGLPTEALLMLALVVATALVGGLLPAVVGAVLGGIALNYFFVAPTRTLTMSDPENAFAVVLFVLTGVAVALVVDASARRTEEAVRARTEANALAVLAHSIVHSGDEPADLLAQTGQVFGMTGAAILTTDGEQPGIEASWGEAMTTATSADARIEIGPGRELLLRGRPLRAEDQSLLTAYAAHFALLAERRAAEAEASQVRDLTEGNRIRTALLAAVSHDLRSPLAAIKAAISSLRNADIVWSPEDEYELLATIEESADRLDALVANLLDMSRLQTQTISPLLAEIDLVATVEWTLSGVADADRVQIDGAESVVLARGDAGLLERVIANVVENAIRHTGRSPVEIRPSSWSDPDGGRWVSLRVSDHGPGVPPESLATIFEPFQRLGDVPRGDGVGLGLAVARGLLEAMGGMLSAEETPGGGLTMVIDLPMADEPIPVVIEPTVPDRDIRAEAAQ
jgi:two-component system, OmpR family, sensor histidine kinase KdpD